MTQFMAAQGDFIIFISLFAFMLCALECTVLNSEEGRERRWLSCFGFYLFESLALLLLLVAPAAAAEATLGDTLVLHAIERNDDIRRVTMSAA